jgi:hypothetical protein
MSRSCGAASTLARTMAWKLDQSIREVVPFPTLRELR